MATISEYFEQAQLSEAAYAAGLTKGMFGGGTEEDPSQYALQLMNEGNGMSLSQAITFANQYTVIDQYTDSLCGFSGTVFQDASGQIFMAMRGTEPLSIFKDWTTNIADIGADGIAIEQGLAMYNWYQQLTSSPGSTVTQYIYHKQTTNLFGGIDQPAWLEETSTVVPLSGGGLVGVSAVSVTGHSLGGHLAMIMSRIAPDMVTSTLTYNAPRFDTSLAVDWSSIPVPQLTLSTTALTSDGFFNLLGNFDNQIGDSWDFGEIINTRIEGDAVSLIGELKGAGGQQQLYSESINAGIIDAHDIKAITDALAIYNLFVTIDPSLCIETISGILGAFPVDNENILEAALATVDGIYSKTYPAIWIDTLQDKTGDISTLRDAA